MPLFGTDGIRAVGYDLILSKLPLKLGWAIGSLSPKTVTVARDTRLSSPEIEEQLTRGLISHGVDVICLGVVPTPLLAYYTKLVGARFGIMITASHNPPEYNGIKMLNSAGEKISHAMETKIERLTARATYGKIRVGTVCRVTDAEERYLNYLSTAHDADFKGISVRLDCCFGAAFKVAEEAFRRFGAMVTADCSSPNGSLVNVFSGSTNIDFLAGRMRRSDFIGFSFDGDGDRVLAVKDGAVFSGDHFLYYISDFLKKQEKLRNNTVVGTVLSNSGLERSLSAGGITFLRSDVGDKYVLELMKHSGAALGGEKSGHILTDGFVLTGDGIRGAILLLDALKHSTLPPYIPIPQKEINIKVKDKSAVINDNRLTETTAFLSKSFVSGGKLLVRESGTEPLIRIMGEGNEQEVDCFLSILKNLIKEINDNLK
ncbi:MAG: phosphoglucosamine mutase [Clostridiaceae bacterium]|jgi:phosphoglucosamine mutase|nr:phosphoglucosamine mutase [Clostridiaceae bacterium]